MFGQKKGAKDAKKPEPKKPGSGVSGQQPQPGSCTTNPSSCSPKK